MGAIQQVLLSASGDAAVPLSHFAATLYTGNNTFPRTITTGVDAQDGLVWVKNRGTQDHQRFTYNGSAWRKVDNATAGAASDFDADATSIDFLPSLTKVNDNAANYVAYSFQNLAGFMDKVLYTGTGAARTIAHNLGVTPAFYVVWSIQGTTAGFQCYHKDAQAVDPEDVSIQLSGTGGTSNSAVWFNDTAPTSSVFSLGTAASVNGNTFSFVAYLFADDSSSTGRSLCGFYTGNGSASGPTITTPWDIRFIMIKRADGTGACHVYDTSRAPSFTGNDLAFLFGQSTAESATDQIAKVSGGYQIITTDTALNANASRYIYVAVR